MDVVRKLLNEISERKAASLDKIPCKRLKLAADIVAPSLAQIFSKSISMDWNGNWPECRPYSRRITMSPKQLPTNNCHSVSC